MTRGASFAAKTVWVLVAAALMQVIACKAKSPERPNILLIVIDTLRADRLGSYGNQQGLTPFLDSLAARGTVFQRAYAASSWTVPSVASLFVAQYPSEHQVVVLNAVLPEDATTLAEVLQHNGYTTGGFSANIQTSAESGFAQGFDRYQLVFSEPKADASDINRAALDWLLEVATRRQPFFLFLQYMELHSPYRTHEGITAVRASDVNASDAELNRRVLSGAENLKDTAVADAWSFSPAEVQRLQQLYDGEARHVDAQLADLFAELERRGLLRNTMVVVTADHGEEFGEHALFEHGFSLFEAAIHVPFIVRVAGNRPAGKVAAPVEISGLAPALLHMLGIAPPASFHIPPLPLDQSAPLTPETYGFSELIKADPRDVRLHQRAVIGATRKLLIDEHGNPLFYDLAHDPGETHAIEAPPFAGELLHAMTRLNNPSFRPVEQKIAPMDETTRERLRALGYTN